MITPYRFYLHGRQGILPGFKPIHAETDDQAKNIAIQTLRDQPSVEWVEVWRDADLIFRLNRHEIADGHVAITAEPKLVSPA